MTNKAHVSLIPVRSRSILRSLFRSTSDLNRRVFDHDYVRRLTECDREAEQDFASYFGDLLRIKLRARLHNAQLVDDVRQEVFLRVLTQLRRKGGIDKPESLGAFVHTVCNNVLLEQFRKEKRQPPASAENADGDGPARPELVDRGLSPEAGLITRERKDRVRAMVETLPPREREILKQVFLEERDRAEICRDLDVTPENLRVIIHRAKTRFRQAYVRAARAS